MTSTKDRVAHPKWIDASRRCRSGAAQTNVTGTATRMNYIWIVEGELTLVTNSGEVLRGGDCAAFQRGVQDGII